MMREFHYPIIRSLVRPNLPLDIERLPLGLIVAPSAGIGFLMMSQGAWKYGAVLWAVSILAWVIFKMMAKADPYMCAVYARSIRYKRIYAPRPMFNGKYRRKLWY
jgi:type IV secretory pathway TrbD component